MFRYISADLLRMRGTHLGAATLGAIGILGVLPGLYVRARGYAGIDVYVTYLQIVNIFLPILASLFVSITIRTEEDQGGFTRLLCAPSRVWAYAAKLLFWTVFSTLFFTCCTVSFATGAGFFGELLIYLGGGAIAGVSMAPIFLLALFVNLAFSSGASIGLGSFGTIVSAIMGTTSVGAQIFWAFPWSYGSMSAANFGLGMFGYTAEGFINGWWTHILAVAAVLLLLVSAGQLLWFSRWEGRRGSE